MNWFQITIPLFVWVAFTCLWAIFNAELIEKGKHPNYLQHNIIKGIVGFIILLWLGVTPRTTLAPFIYLVTSFWVIFNPLLNTLRALPFFYTGSESGWIDSWLSRNPYWIRVALYIVAFILMVLSIIVIYYTL